MTLPGNFRNTLFKPSFEYNRQIKWQFHIFKETNDMRCSLLLIIFLCSLCLNAQELYRYNADQKTAWSSFENLNGKSAAGGKENNSAKGHPSELIKPGESRELLNISGAGIIQRIWMTVRERQPATLRSMTIEIYWDHESTPAVSAPLPDFFGNGLGQITAFQNALFSSPEGRSFNCYIPMPFNKGARVVVKNESTKTQNLFFDINFQRTPSHGADILYFHAFWNNNRKMKLGEDYTILPTIRGKGRFLGVNFGVIADSIYGKSWFGEGEVKIYLDSDSQYPSLVGSGTEDYIGTGWGQGKFIQQYQGCAVANDSLHEYSFYRYHIPDPVYFSNALKIDIQQIGGDATASVKKFAADGAKLIPVTVAQDTGLIKLFEMKNPPAINDSNFPEGWTNFYRVDNYSSIAFFYLNKPVSSLPPLPSIEERTKGIRKN
jgi:hypothetical protein